MEGYISCYQEYKFWFNGQEQDDEIKGKGNIIDYKYRLHDPRIGRFLSLDPLAPDYPYNSPYAFSKNRVIDAVELEGLECLPTNRDGNGSPPSYGGSFSAPSRAPSTSPAPSRAPAAPPAPGNAPSAPPVPGASLKPPSVPSLPPISQPLTVGLPTNVPGNSTEPDNIDKPNEEDSRKYLYRTGNMTSANFTPALGKDTNPNNPDKGLSTYSSKKAAYAKLGPTKLLRLDKMSLITKGMILNHGSNGHVSILPPDGSQESLENWASYKEN